MILGKFVPHIAFCCLVDLSLCSRISVLCPCFMKEIASLNFVVISLIIWAQFSFPLWKYCPGSNFFIFHFLYLFIYTFISTRKESFLFIIQHSVFIFFQPLGTFSQRSEAVVELLTMKGSPYPLAMITKCLNCVIY